MGLTSVFTLSFGVLDPCSISCWPLGFWLEVGWLALKKSLDASRFWDVPTTSGKTPFAIRWAFWLIVWIIRPVFAFVSISCAYDGGIWLWMKFGKAFNGEDPINCRPGCAPALEYASELEITEVALACFPFIWDWLMLSFATLSSGLTELVSLFGGLRACSTNGATILRACSFGLIFTR